MNITILTAGTRGDVQPYVALGLGLKKHGHSVRIATYESFRSFVVDHGLGFAPLIGDPFAELKSKSGKKMVNSGKNPIKFLLNSFQLHAPNMGQFLVDSWNACKDADLILYSNLGFAAPHIAEAIKITAISVPLQPVYRSSEYAALNLSERKHFRKIYNWMTHMFAEQMFWQPLRPIINDWRHKYLGLKDAPLFGPFGKLDRQKQPFLFGFSKYVFPKPIDWGDWLHITGYWFLNEGKQYKPSHELTKFLNKGEKPVFFSFSSGWSENTKAKLKICLDFLEKTGSRGIINATLSDDLIKILPNQVFYIENVPYDWLFPKIKLAIHYGGTGVTSECLRAAIPSIPVPFFGDQPLWASRVAELKVGSNPIPGKLLSTKKLLEAWGEISKNKKIKDNLKRISKEINNEDGVVNAIEAINFHTSEMSIKDNKTGSKYKLCVDLRTTHKTGVFRYGISIVKNLLPLLRASKVKTYIIYNRNAASEIESIYNSYFYNKNEVELIQDNSKTKFTRDDEWLRKLLVRENIDLFYSINYLVDSKCPIPYIFTIFDLIRLKYPELSYTDKAFQSKFGDEEFKRIKLELDRLGNPPTIKDDQSTFQKYFWALNEYLCKNATGIVTISNSAKEDIATILKVPTPKISVIEGAVNHEVFFRRDGQLISSTKRKFNLSDDYCLYVGLGHKHKRLEWLVNGIIGNNLRLNNEKQLIIVGKHSDQFRYLKEKVTRAGLDEAILFVGSVSDRELAALYSGSKALVVTSIDEGFCLPALEAFACGCEVIAPKIKPILETTKGCAHLYDADDQNGLISLFFDVLNDKLKRKSNTYVDVYDWQKSSIKLFDLIIKTLKEQRR